MQHIRIDRGAHHWCCKTGVVDVPLGEKGPSLPMEVLRWESWAGEVARERCRSPGTLPAAGYEDVQKGRWCVCFSQLNLFG